MAPVDDLPIGVMRVVCTEGRPADETLEHDCSQAPPIAVKTVALAAKDLRCNIVRRADS